jgi:hypothetical protein
MKEKIEKLRQEMHQLISCTHADYEKILFVSRKLDKLIVEYCKTHDVSVKLIRVS